MSLKKQEKRSARFGRYGKASLAVRSLHQSPEYSADAMTRRVVEVLGNNMVAALLGVSNDRPSRWASGRESPSGENRAQLADLDSMMGQLLTAFTPGQAALWLNGHDPFLDARPIDVYRIEGAGPVIEAMKAYEQGAYA